MSDDFSNIWNKFVQKETIIEKSVCLTDEQENIFNLINAGENILLTGKAGTGKSFTIHEIKKRYPSTVLTGTTGVAAVNIGGMTIHSWAGVGKGEDSPEIIANRLLKYSKNQKYVDRIRACRRLIIDEVSMLKADFFDMLDKVFKMVRNKGDIPFGGIQLILVGDFLQLPPVETRKDAYKNPIETKFCFEGNSWKEADIKVQQLTKIFRQSDIVFCEILNRIREGVYNADDLNTLSIRSNLLVPDKAVKIFGDNNSVDYVNNEEVSKLEGEEKVFYKSDYFGVDDEEEISNLKRDLDNACLAPDILKLKIGVRVMMLRNTLIDLGIVNGSCGNVIEFTESGLPKILFDNGVEEVIDYTRWEIKESEDLILASRKQLPLKVAYAVTINKSQGQTLDLVECNFEKVYYEAQVYVALSRARTLDGLYIKGLKKDKIKANKKALNFYKMLEFNHNI